MSSVTPLLKTALAAALAASLVLPAAAIAKPAPSSKSAKNKRELRIVVRPKSHRYHGGRYGFLPGYRQPPDLADWRDRSPQHGGGDFTDYPYEMRYWSGGTWRYGWGYPGFYRGQWNGGTFGPCWTTTPIGRIWNCGM